MLTCRDGYDNLIHVDTEEYPSLAEGVGLENREASKGARGFESLLLRHIQFHIALYYAGLAQLVEQLTCNQ